MRFYLPILLGLILASVTLRHSQAQAPVIPRDTAKLPAAPEGITTLGDWTSGPKTVLSLREGLLSVASSGNSPFFDSGVLPPMRGPYFLEFRASSNLMGPVEIFWNTTPSSTPPSPAFNDQNKIAVGEAKPFDGKYRHYLVELPQTVIAPLHSLRIAPGHSSGEALFEFIRIRSMTGKIYKEWGKEWKESK